MGNLGERTFQLVFDLNEVHDYLGLMRDASGEESGENKLINIVLDTKGQLRTLQSLIDLAYDTIHYLSCAIIADDLAKEGCSPGQDPRIIRELAIEMYLKFTVAYKTTIR